MACGIGKLAENAKHQRLSLQIVFKGILRRLIDSLPGAGKPRQTGQIVSAVMQAPRHPGIDGIQKGAKRPCIGAGQRLAQFVQRFGIDRW